MDTTHDEALASRLDIPTRSPADLAARRFLRLPPDAPKVSLFAAQSAFGKSVAISGIRCLITYIFLPILGPVLGLSGGFGPILGLVIGTISMVSIVLAVRRFFSADHKWRWGYATIGGGIFVLLIALAIIDLRALVG